MTESDSNIEKVEKDHDEIISNIKFLESEIDKLKDRIDELEDKSENESEDKSDFEILYETLTYLGEKIQSFELMRDKVIENTDIKILHNHITKIQKPIDELIET